MEQQNETPDGAGSGGISSRGAEITVALVILFIGCVVAFDSFRLGAGWSPDGPQAGYFPFYTGVLICISGLVTLGQTLFSKMPRGKIFVEWGALRQVLSVLLPAAVYVLGIQLVGIYVASALYIAGFMRWLGHYGWAKSIALGVIVSAVSYMMFEVWFQVQLYKGVYDLLGFLGYS